MDGIGKWKEWLSEHIKIVMAAVLFICVAITVFGAVNANRKAEEVEAQLAEEPEADPVPDEEEAAETQQEAEIPQLELEENAYPAVNALMENYYEAVAAGDVDAVVSMNEYLNDKEKMRIREMGRYIEGYPELTVYTKKGPVEGSYLAYVYSKMKFTEYDGLVPGMQAFYVSTDENGDCYINNGESNPIVVQYITDVSLQEDLVDLNNRITAEYNELLDTDGELSAFLYDLSKRIDVSVGEALAKAETEQAQQQEEEPQENEDGQAGDEGEPQESEAESQENEAEPQENEDVPQGDGEPEAQEQPETAAPVVKKVKATAVVNIRSSDSETADRIGKAQVGDEFTLLDALGNGWSKISFEGRDAFIKSDFLEVFSEEQAADGGAGDAAEVGENDTQTAAASADSSAQPAGNGETVTVKTSVNVRKSASEDGEKLGLAYTGEKLELLMKQADGWTRVKYKGQTAFVKSEFVE